MLPSSSWDHDGQAGFARAYSIVQFACTALDSVSCYWQVGFQCYSIGPGTYDGPLGSCSYA